MKRSIFITMALMVACIVNAQDVITLANGESFYAKNIRFSGDKVYFNRWSESGTSQSVTTMNTSDLSKIVYESGEEEFFQKVNPNAKVNTNSGNTVNVNVTGPVNNNYVGNSPNYNANSGRDHGYQVEFLDNPHFNAYAEGYAALFSNNDGHGSFGGFNSFYTGVSTSAGIRLNNYLFLGAGMGFLFGNGHLPSDYYYDNRIYRDAPSWYLPIYFEARGFIPINDDFSLGARLAVGFEFNEYSSKRDWYDGTKCGKVHLDFSLGAEISHIAVNMGVMSFQSMERREEYYDNYYTGDHSHTVRYSSKTIPVLYLKVGYKFGE